MKLTPQHRKQAFDYQRAFEQSSDTMAYFNLSDEEWERIPESAQLKLRAYVFTANT